MNDLLLNIDAGAINWARAQFALTAIYHWLFVPLTLSHSGCFLERHCQVLAEALRHQFRHGCCDGYHSRI